MEAGLYLVGTPIGNLGDLTERAKNTLRDVEWIYAEDTRRTRALLSHLGIRGKRLASFHAHSNRQSLDALLAHLEAGLSVALVTDAGMPCVSDPGALLVRAARQRQFRVVVIPGPSAAIAAVAASGLVDGPFCFLGFLPRRGQKRDQALERIRRASEPVVLFEAPRRAAETLQELALLCPERQVCVCRELTKLHEEVLVGSARDLVERVAEWRGEVTLVVAAPDAGTLEREDVDLEASILSMLRAGESPKAIAETLSQAAHESKRSVYQKVLELKAREHSSTEG